MSKQPGGSNQAAMAFVITQVDINYLFLNINISVLEARHEVSEYPLSLTQWPDFK
jgi:hypothetical protein